FDEGTGTTVADLSGNGRNGTLVGGTAWVVSTIPPLQTTVSNVVTTLADSGVGSLREAISNANACSGAITFAVNGAIHLPSSLPVRTTHPIVLGPGPNTLTIDGAGASRLFYFSPATTNRVSGLRLVNASAAASGASIWNYGQTVLESCIISNSSTASGFGGAI